MPYAKHTTTPPPFDALTAAKAPAGPAWEKFPEWKRWVEATGTQDGRGLKDVVEANAIGMDKLKVDVDQQREAAAQLFKTVQQLAARISALETTPPFPG
jgi:hypothetical protein